MSLHVLSLTCLSVPFCGRPERSVIQQLMWPAETAGRLWNLDVLGSNLNIVYVILCFEAKNKVFSFFRTLLLSPSAPSPDNQVPLHEDNRDLTDFITHEGLFCYKRVCYGLASALAAFQKLISAILKDVLGVQCYLDDIIVEIVGSQKRSPCLRLDH